MKVAEELDKYNFTIVGAGYVGMSFAALVSEYCDTNIVELSSKKVEMINNRVSPIKDKEIEESFKNKKLKLKASKVLSTSISDDSFVVIATPTNYDPDKNFFDTSSVEGVIKSIMESNKKVTIVIKSTIPIGFTEKMKKKYNNNRIIFSPEFLREGSALFDNLHPSRIIVGSDTEHGKIFGSILKACSLDEDTPLIFMDSSTAEAVKLFSNTYLAMRVSFFNELDSFASVNNLDTKSLINGVSADPRIGNYYNNPSFGYGGYCLPKDSKQLLANFNNTPQKLISAIVESNDTRKDFLNGLILEKKPRIVGFYRLIMKTGSDNFRESAIQGLIKRIDKAGLEILIYEPQIEESQFDGYKVEKDISAFKSIPDLIVANRIDKTLEDISDKVFTRDVLGSD